MALLYIDGFEGYTNVTDITRVGSGEPRFTYIHSGNSLSSTIYRTAQVTPANSRSLYADTSMPVDFKIPARTEFIMGLAVYIVSNNTSVLSVWNVGNTSLSSQGVCLAYRPSSNTFFIYTAGTNGAPGTLLGTASGTYGQNTWHYIELRLKLGTTTGEAELKINGIQVLNLTNINTATGSITAYSAMGKASTNVVEAYYDDLYICDTSGSVNNTFLGPISVYTLMPTSNASSTQLTPVGAASNWQAVDEPTADTTTYVETSTTGHRDYYNFESLPAGVSSVFGVLTRAKSTTPDNGGRRVRLNFKNGANVLSSAARLLTLGNWLYEYFIAETAPDGSAWSKTSVDSTEAGVEAQ